MEKYQRIPQWTQRLFATMNSCWNYHTPCSCINFQAWHDPNLNLWQIKAAPVYQECYGGEDDGKKIWSGFLFDMGNFQRQRGVWIEEQALMSRCEEQSKYPKIAAKGKFEGHDIFMEIFLEPIAETKVKEIVDTVTNEIRPVEDEDDNTDEPPPYEPEENDDEE